MINQEEYINMILHLLLPVIVVTGAVILIIWLNKYRKKEEDSEIEIDEFEEWD